MVDIEAIKSELLNDLKQEMRDELKREQTLEALKKELPENFKHESLEGLSTEQQIDFVQRFVKAIPEQERDVQDPIPVDGANTTIRARGMSEIAKENLEMINKNRAEGKHAVEIGA